jgi:hypothetical protein
MGGMQKRLAESVLIGIIKIGMAVSLDEKSARLDG